MASEMQIIPAVAVEIIPPQASTDVELVRLWLNRYRPDGEASRTNTTRAYEADIRKFGACVTKSLRSVTIHDLQGFAATLVGLADSTRCRRLSSIKSLIAFGHQVGYLQFDVGAAIRLPAIKDTLSERILSEEQVQRLFWSAEGTNLRGPYVKRDAAMLRLLYIAGLRISELCSLCWRDLAPRDPAGQITVFGKGGKTRAILLPPSMWARLVALRGSAAPQVPVFRSRRGGRLYRASVHKIIKIAVKRAKLPPEVSAHYLRHAHASHALDRGAPVHVVQTTLGHASLSTTTRYTHARPGDSSSKYLNS